jgi:hypothetical protein
LHIGEEVQCFQAFFFERGFLSAKGLSHAVQELALYDFGLRAVQTLQANERNVLRLRGERWNGCEIQKEQQAKKFHKKIEPKGK